jgi:hypothetical protein
VAGLDCSARTEVVTTALRGGVVAPPSSAEVEHVEGFYAWWCQPDCLAEARPPIPASASDDSGRRTLLCVGICFRKGSPRRLPDRIVGDHSEGNAGGPTSRFSLASLVRDTLALTPRIGKDEPQSRRTCSHD